METTQGPGPSGEPLEASAALLKREEATNEALAAGLALAKEHSDRQGWIAKVVIGLYSGVLGLAVLAYGASALLPSRQANLGIAGGQIRDAANTLVLPLVTLVIGHYFGQRSR